MTATEWPWSSRLWARVAPTRPHPMITKCTVRHAIPCRGSPRAPSCGGPGVRGPRIAHRVGPLGCRQTTVARTSGPQRPARPHPPAEAHRAAGVRVGRALVGGVRARRDPADALAGRPVGARRLAVGRSGGRRSSCSPSSRRTGRTCTPTPRAAATTRSRRSTSARTPASPSPARCSWTTCSPSRCRSRRAPSTPPRRSRALRGHEAAFAIGLVVLLTVANLRGVKESGSLFAIPVYLFMFAIGPIAVVGAVRMLTGNLPMAESAGFELAAGRGVRPGAHRAGRLLPDPARVRVGLCRADRCRGDQQRRAGVQEAQVQERGDDARAAGRPVDRDDHGDPAARPRDGRDVRRRPADAAAATTACPVGDPLRAAPGDQPARPARCSRACRSRRPRRHRHRPDPRARREHGVQRLPGAGLDPGARRLPARASCTPAATGSRSPTASSRSRSSRSR